MFNYCPDCGTKNEGWNFCPTCGRALSETAPTTSKKAADNKELDSVLSMIKKFEAELADAENDEATLLSMPAENLGLFSREMQYRLKNTTIDNADIGVSFSLDQYTEGLPSIYAKFKISSIDIHDDGAQYVAKVSFTALAMIDVLVLSEQPLYIGLPTN